MIPIENISREEIERLIQKYEQPLSTLREAELYPYYVVAIDIAESFFNKKNDVFNGHWKSLIVLFIVKSISHFNNRFDVEKFILDFEKCYKSEYDKYLNISITEDEFERDFKFLKIFVDKRYR
jgi:hypothetical protein